MTQTSKPILFFGTEDFSAITLRALIKAGYNIRAVITKTDSKKGRGQQVAMPRVKKIAQEHDIVVWQPEKLTDIRDDIAALGDVAGVLVSYGKIIPESIIDLFHPGIINLHPSLLPHYRGPSPIESAILNDDEETGISIMQLSKEMDAGPVYAQVGFPLARTETKPELYEALGALGTDALLSCLPQILDGTLLPHAQDEARATYCQLLQKSDGLLEPTALSARQAEQHVRAYSGFPKSKLNVNGQIIIITKAHVTDTQKTPLDIQFQDGAFLSITELVAPSGKTMNADAFLRGYAAG